MALSDCEAFIVPPNVIGQVTIDNVPPAPPNTTLLVEISFDGVTWQFQDQTGGIAPGGPFQIPEFTGPWAPGTSIWFRWTELLDNNVVDQIECGPFTLPLLVSWCGAEYNQDDCLLVDTGNGETYFNCWPPAIRDGFPGEGIGHS